MRRLDRGFQTLQAEGHIDHGAVEEKSRSGPDPGLFRRAAVLLHALGVDAVRHLTIEAKHVQAQGLGITGQSSQFQVVWLSEQQVVHRPELALRSSRFRSLSRQLRVRVNLDQRIVAEHETQALTERLHEMPGQRFGLNAGGTFVVAVFQQGQRCVLVTLSVVCATQGEHLRFRLRWGVGCVGRHGCSLADEKGLQARTPARAKASANVTPRSRAGLSDGAQWAEKKSQIELPRCVGSRVIYLSFRRNCSRACQPRASDSRSSMAGTPARLTRTSANGTVER